MDVDTGLLGGVKHLWEIVVTGMSAVISYVLYKFKKSNDQTAADRKMLLDHDTLLQIFDERLKNIDADMVEIKDYLKKILFKL